MTNRQAQGWLTAEPEGGEGGGGGVGCCAQQRIILTKSICAEMMIGKSQSPSKVTALYDLACCFFQAKSSIWAASMKKTRKRKIDTASSSCFCECARRCSRC